VVEEAALGGQAAPVADQVAALPYDAMAGDDDRELIRRYDLSNVSRV